MGLHQLAGATTCRACCRNSRRLRCKPLRVSRSAAAALVPTSEGCGGSSHDIESTLAINAWLRLD
jgi:hypothetical protein